MLHGTFKSGRDRFLDGTMLVSSATCSNNLGGKSVDHK